MNLQNCDHWFSILSILSCQGEITRPIFMTELTSIGTYFAKHQDARPSGHSYVIMASHVSFIAAIFTAFRYGKLVEGFGLALSCVISLHYHLCDENLHCPYGIGIEGWHALDVWSTFFLVCFIFAVMVLDLKSKKAKFIVRVVYFIAVTGSVMYDKSSMVLFGGLLASVGLLITLKVFKQVYFTSSNNARRATTGSTTTAPVKDLVAGLTIFAISLGCFVLANTPGALGIGGYTRYDPKRDGPLKPMDMPDTSTYWLFHSIWHFASAISALFILRYLVAQSKENK